MRSRTTCTHADYVRAHTNATFVVGEEYGFADGLFAGFDEAAGQLRQDGLGLRAGAGRLCPPRPPPLEHPRSVFQLLKQHYDRYTPDVVADVAGCSAEEFLRMAEIICSTGRADRVGTIMYAVAGPCTRSAARSSAPRRSCSCCSATSAGPGAASTRCAGTPTCREPRTTPSSPVSLPGYLKVPTPPQQSLAAHLRDSTPRPLVADTVNYWGNYPKFYVLADEGVVRGAGDARQRLRLPLPRQAGRRRDVAVDLGQGAPGDAGRLRRPRLQPAAGRPRRAAPARRDVEAEVEGGHRPLHARLGRVLEGAGHGPGPDRHRGALSAVVPLDRARRLVHQQRALGAVEGEGHRPRRSGCAPTPGSCPISSGG